MCSQQVQEKNRDALRAASLWEALVQLEEALPLFANLTLTRDHIRIASKTHFIINLPQTASHHIHSAAVKVVVDEEYLKNGAPLRSE